MPHLFRERARRQAEREFGISPRGREAGIAGFVDVLAEGLTTSAARRARTSDILQRAIVEERLRRGGEQRAALRERLRITGATPEEALEAERFAFQPERRRVGRERVAVAARRAGALQEAIRGPLPGVPLLPGVTAEQAARIPRTELALRALRRRPAEEPPSTLEQIRQIELANLRAGRPARPPAPARVRTLSEELKTDIDDARAALDPDTPFAEVQIIGSLGNAIRLAGDPNFPQVQAFSTLAGALVEVSDDTAAMASVVRDAVERARTDKDFRERLGPKGRLNLRLLEQRVKAPGKFRKFFGALPTLKLSLGGEVL